MKASDTEEELRRISHQIMFEIAVSKGFGISGKGLWPPHQEPKNPNQYVIIENGCVWYSKLYGGGAYEAAFDFDIHDGNFRIHWIGNDGYVNRPQHRSFSICDPSLYDQIWNTMVEIFSRMQINRGKGSDLLC